MERMKKVQEEAEMALKKAQEDIKKVSRQRKEGDGELEEGRQSTVEYQGLGVQRKTGEEISGPICRSIHN